LGEKRNYRGLEKMMKNHGSACPIAAIF